MGKKSTKENKTIYQTLREEAGLTRAAAAEALEFISEDRIEKIEYEKTSPLPEEVFAMSKAYKAPDLCNHYCSHICRIGQDYVPEVKIKDLSQITLEMLASLNTLNKEKERFVEIAVDGKITEDEMQDFERIREQLNQIMMAVNSLNLWVKKVMDDNEG